MKVFITGASGFLGEWVVKHCLKQGYQVKILCRKSSDLSKLDGLKYEKVYGDILNAQSIQQALKEDIDLVIHLAGKIAYKKSEYNSMWQINVEGTKNIITAMKDNGIQDMIYLSSVVAIGSSKKPTVLNENSSFDIADLKLGYFDSKHAAENEILNAFKNNIIRPVIINPSTIYGAGDASKSSRKIQIKVANGKFPFYTSGGVNVVYIHDVVRLMFYAYSKKIFGERIIAASDDNITIKTLFRTIADFSGAPKPWIYLPNFIVFLLGYFGQFLEVFGKKGPISLENAYTSTMFHWFDNSKAKNFGFEFTSSKKAIQESVNWAKEHGYVD